MTVRREKVQIAIDEFRIVDTIRKIRDSRQVRFPGWVMEDDDKTDDKPEDDKSEDKSDDKGFPQDTPVAEMTDKQRAAYYEHNSRKHEDRNKEILKLTGGKYGDSLKADLEELEELRKGKRTDSENAVEEAKKQTRAEAQKEFGAKLVEAKFEAALSHIEEARRNSIIDGLNLEKYLDSDGNVDADKVKTFASTVAPDDPGKGKGKHDFGGGRRGGDRPTGVAAGQDMFLESRKKKTTSTSS